MGPDYYSAALGGSKPQPVVGQHGIPRTLSSASEPYQYFPRPGISFNDSLKGLNLVGRPKYGKEQELSWCIVACM